MDNKRKLLYITRYSLHQGFNLKSKFDGQMSAFENLGFEVYFVGFDEKHFYLVSSKGKTVIGNTHFWVPSYLHTQFYNDLHKAAVKAINTVGFDYVYWRAAPLWSSSCKVAKTIKKLGAKLIYEIPTFPQQKEEHLSGLRKMFTLYSDRFTDRFNSLVDYYVLIGEDAGGEYKGKPAINIENGIDLSNIPVRTPINKDGEIHLLALASMCYWHGYDRIINSIAKYQGEYMVYLHMVGGNDGGCLEQWQNLSKELGVSNNVIFHGPLSGTDLDEMFDLCDLGINSLGMYRKDFAVTMELKAREYIARGLPFVCAVEDPGFAGIEDVMWLRIPNDESIPDMQRIVDFALRMEQDFSHNKRLRYIAENRLTWEEQLKKVFDVVGGNRL